MDKAKPIGVDASGFALLTEAVKDLLNQYPGMYEEIKFEELEPESGVAFSADNGALIMTERVSITDHVTRTCQYPFYIVFRSKSDLERQKLKAQTFLNEIGKFICKETIVADGQEYRLKNYPALTEGRTITNVTRMNSYGLEPSEDKVQDWLLPCTVEYKHEFDKW